jgi:uncharacterized protein YecT (DUF1311 family)
MNPHDMRRVITASAIALVVALHGAAAQKVPDPCVVDPETGPTTAQLRACSQRQYEVAEAALAKLLGEVRARSDDSATVRRNALEKSQSAWLVYRAAACEAAYLEVFPGSFATVHRYDCLRRLSDERIAELRRTYFPDL